MVLSLVGTRPEAIKMAPFIKEVSLYPDRIRSIVCATAQHREMLDQVLSLFNIDVDVDLNVMEHDQSLSRLTTNLLDHLDPIMERMRPDWVVAEGDTTTVLAAALVSYYHRVRFGHVEAGLRTGDKYAPYPEEMNRRIADQLADVLFAPTTQNRQNLLSEGVPDAKILVTGNTVVDALLTTAQMPYKWDSGPLAKVPLDKKLVLVTAHRRESIGAKLMEICLAIKELASRFGSLGFHFVLPVHLNPNVRNTVNEILSGLPDVSLTQPLDYLSMVQLMKRSTVILTDSGGIQEEAPSLGVPVLIMRDTTERPEGVQAGVARIAGTKCDNIVEEATSLLLDPAKRAAMSRQMSPYGDGKAAKRIVSFFLGSSDAVPLHR